MQMMWYDILIFIIGFIIGGMIFYKCGKEQSKIERARDEEGKIEDGS
jgi:hypothetical protein